jgi:hypothetical protein
MSEKVSQEELKKVTDEVKELRRELAKIREEAKEKGESVEGYALGFKIDEFMSMSQTKSLQWVTNVLAVRLKERIAKYRSYFGPILLLGGGSEMEAWTCAGFNRGGTCHSKWHVYERFGHRAHRDFTAVRSARMPWVSSVSIGWLIAHGSKGRPGMKSPE